MGLEPAFIAFGVVTFSRETTFPGLSALAPCTGTVLIIYSGDGTKAFINRILSAKPVVFLGLISYSLYLLHWPLLAFSKKLCDPAFGLGTNWNDHRV